MGICLTWYCIPFWEFFLAVVLENILVYIIFCTCFHNNNNMFIITHRFSHTGPLFLVVGGRWHSPAFRNSLSQARPALHDANDEIPVRHDAEGGRPLPARGPARWPEKLGPDRGAGRKECTQSLTITTPW